MPKAARAVIDTMRQNYLSAPYSVAGTPKKANVQAAFFTKTEIQAFRLRQKMMSHKNFRGRPWNDECTTLQNVRR